MPCFKQIIIGSDHAGFLLKETLKAFLQQHSITVEDVGCYSTDSVDYPDISKKVATQVLETPGAAGVLVCGSGVGVSIAANRFNGIRAVLANDFHAAKWSRLHNNANIICLGARVVAPELATQLLEVWLNTEYEGERHDHRVHLMDQLIAPEQTTAAKALETEGAVAPQCSI